MRGRGANRVSLTERTEGTENCDRRFTAEARRTQRKDQFSFLLTPLQEVSPSAGQGRRNENPGSATAWRLRFRFAKGCHERKRKSVIR